MDKAAGYHGIQGVKTALKSTTGYAAPVAMEYARALNLDKQLTAVDRYADNRKILAIPSDKGYSGNLATTAQDIDLELALGYLLQGVNGLMDVTVTYFPRMAVYYEITLNYEHKPAEVLKVWALNAEIRKGSLAHQTDEENLELGDYTYPITVYGDPALDTEGNEYRDATGNKKNCYLMYAFPEDTGYATFGDAVPDPTVE